MIKSLYIDKAHHQFQALLSCGQAEQIEAFLLQFNSHQISELICALNSEQQSALWRLIPLYDQQF